MALVALMNVRNGRISSIRKPPIIWSKSGRERRTLQVIENWTDPGLEAAMRPGEVRTNPYRFYDAQGYPTFEVRVVDLQSIDIRKRQRIQDPVILEDPLSVGDFAELSNVDITTIIRDGSRR